METASRAIGRTGGSRFEQLVLVGLVGAFVCVLGIGAVGALRMTRSLDDHRAAASRESSDPAQAAGERAVAFRRFRATLADGSRFALVYGDDVDRDQRGFYRLFGGYYLYPAVAVERAEEADAVMVFGEPSVALRDAFEELGQVDGVWLGRRAGS